MSFFTYDCEVSAFDWLVVFKEKVSGIYTILHNDNQALREFLTAEDVYCGFNSKHYDQFIIKAIYADFTPQEIKKLNDWLILGKDNQGWNYGPLKDYYFQFNNIDIKDDTQAGLSLKAIEGHFGLSVEETTVDFNLDRPWTEQELQEMIHYCKHDVDATEHLIDVRKEYLKTKTHIGQLSGIDPIRSMSMTNAKLTAAFLKANPPMKPWTDERKYQFPENLKLEYIPTEVIDFFKRMYREDLDDEDVFKSQLKISVGGTPTVIGYGGIHAAIPNYVWKQDEHTTIIRNFDVASYYPHLMTVNGYTSRNIPNPKIYSDMLEERMQAKRNGDKVTANALKLVANTTYGATLNKYNPLYDPLMARSVCISGQLYLLELSEHLLDEVPGLKIVQLNTDGIMVEFEETDYPKVLEITDEWQKRTGFELEEDKIKSIVQNNVNNYVEIGEDGGVKAKGGYLVRGIAPAGAFNVNNNATIIAKAILDYFVNKTPVEETVNACNDVACFQLIAKAGTMYRESYHLVDGEKLPVQKVNRVYATSDERYGKVFKVKTDDSEAKIGSLPEHCLIDNTAISDPRHTKIDRIDKSWYIQQAKDGINRFLGIMPEKPKKERKSKMAGTTTKKTPEMENLNVYAKLAMARTKFLEAGVKKSGKNMKMKYKYFELDDIVPIALPIFEECHLVAITSFTNDLATLTIVNCDSPDQCINFTSPMKEIEPIISSTTGGEVTNAIQRLGSVETYQRRYLYMIALDIVEADEMEATTGINEPAPAPAPHAPVTPEKREEIKKELTATDEPADSLQLDALKAAVKKLRAIPGTEDKCVKIALDTNGFTNVSKAKCEALIHAITAEVNASEKENANA